MTEPKICGIRKARSGVCQREATVLTEEKGLICLRHYSGFRAHNLVRKAKRVCKVDGCFKGFYCKGYCERHYWQLHVHRKILNVDRTKFDPNVIRVGRDTAAIILCDQRGFPIAETLIDKTFIEIVRGYKWHLHHEGYAESGSNSIFLHHLVLGRPPVGMEIDHINRNRLDNRFENLRSVTFGQNNMNVSVGTNNTSGVTGVSWHKGARKWQAGIMLDYKNKHLGLFERKQDAIDARKEAERKYFGEYSPK